MLTGIYIGPIRKLEGHTALLMQSKVIESNYEAQFDKEVWWDQKNLALGWHEFPKVHFRVLPSELGAHGTI